MCVDLRDRRDSILPLNCCCMHGRTHSVILSIVYSVILSIDYSVILPIR